jgi:hypothetical protein
MYMKKSLYVFLAVCILYGASAAPVYGFPAPFSLQLKAKISPFHKWVLENIFGDDDEEEKKEEGAGPEAASEECVDLSMELGAEEQKGQALKGNIQAAQQVLNLTQDEIAKQKAKNNASMAQMPIVVKLAVPYASVGGPVTATITLNKGSSIINTYAIDLYDDKNIHYKALLSDQQVTVTARPTTFYKSVTIPAGVAPGFYSFVVRDVNNVDAYGYASLTITK